MQSSGVPFFISGGSSGGGGTGNVPSGGTAGQYLKKLSATNYDSTWASFALTNSDIDAAAAIAWSKLDKTGSSLADLATRSASDLSSGTLPDARFPATLPAASGANLTNLSASALTAGTVPLARLSGITDTEISATAAIAWTKLSKTGSSLADLATRSASDLSSGTLPDARFPATLPAASGVNLTALNASNLGSGTVPLARLSGITNTEIDAAAAIAWSKISKTGSSLADLATRTTANLSDFPSQTSNANKALVTSGSALSFGYPQGCFVIACSDETTAITTGTAKVTFRAPFAFTIPTIPRASLTAASTSGTPTVDINEAGTSILSTKLTIDANELTSTTAATPAVLSDTSIADDAEITIDVDTAGTGAKGLKVYIYYVRS